MRPLAHLIVKEWLVLLHDWHALLLLFAMPVLFILVMSLALRDQFAAHKGVSITYYLVNRDAHEDALSVEQRLRDDASFQHVATPAGEGESELAARVARDEVHFLVVIPEGFGVEMRGEHPLAVRTFSAPGVAPAVAMLFEAAVKGAVTRAHTERSVEELQLAAPRDPEGSTNVDFEAGERLVARASLDGDEPERPTAVQQNVPAWLLFAMFFIAIPLSTTWVQERQQGTFARLRAMGVPRHRLLLGKLLPYFAINLLQVVSMLSVGVLVVPLFGGDALTLGHSTAALVVMALAVSFASVSYALLIANVVSTSEQATIFTGVSNLLLAALGGIMVPRFVMPPLMQEISLASPMAWGLEGFLDIFLRRGGLAEVRGEALLLVAFGLASIAGAALFMGRVRGK